MAVKTFTTGEVLSSADTNTYLANSGLVVVKSQTIGSAVSSVTVTGAFSSTYDAYKIVITSGNTSADCELRLQLGSATSPYYSSIIGVTSANAVTSTRRQNTVAFFDFVGNGSTNMMSANIDLINPFLVKTKTLTASNILPTANMSLTTGYMDSTTSFTAFTITPSTGTMTGGIITVYGYRLG
jgi:hypothetical protein